MDNSMKCDNGDLVVVRESIPEVSAARLKFLEDVENATTGPELVRATIQYGQGDKGQSSFAFNRAKKVLDHFQLLQGPKSQRAFGSMGKAREDFYALFNDLSDRVLEHVKNALVFDSRVTKMRAGQGLFPDRHGRVLEDTASKTQTRGRKKKRVASEISAEDQLPDEKVASDGGVAQSSSLAAEELNSQPLSAAELDERVRSIKAARLADAVAHPSFQQLSADQQHVIKDLWVQSLVGSGAI